MAYLNHAHNHITRAVSAMDSCFGIVRPHQHGRHSRRVAIGLKALCSVPLTAEASAEHPFKCQLHTTHVGAKENDRRAAQHGTKTNC